jgi:hypothetical protein
VPEDGNCQFHAVSHQLESKGVCSVSAAVSIYSHRPVVMVAVQEARERVVRWLMASGGTMLVEKNPDVTIAAFTGEADWIGWHHRAIGSSAEYLVCQVLCKDGV